MAKADVLDILRTKNMDPLEFHFENLWIPHMYNYLSPQDIAELRSIATSNRLSSKIRQKYDMIDAIMTRRGFKRFSAGTNRVVYRFLDDTRFLVKIAVDKVGMQDNPLEYKNQFLLQPYVTKMFYISECGTVGFCERVLPIKNRAEFAEIASDVFDILVNKILGLYVVEDVGTRYFMNWGIRAGFGPVLLDYPYVYKLDGDKLFCNWVNPDTGIICDGEIDYDSGFNHLVCSRCGKIYLATNLRDDSTDNNLIIRKGGHEMKVVIKKGDKIISAPIPTDEVMRPEVRKHKVPEGFKPPVIRVNTPTSIVKCDVNGIIECVKKDTNGNIITNITESKKPENNNEYRYKAQVENEISSSVNKSSVADGVKKTVIDDTKIMKNNEDAKNPEVEEAVIATKEDVSTKKTMFPIITSSFIKPKAAVEDQSDNNIDKSDSNSDQEDDTDDYENDYDSTEEPEDDTVEEDVFASDVDIQRRNDRVRAERNSQQIISNGNGNIYGKKNKKKNKNKNKNNYIPNIDNTYRKG